MSANRGRGRVQAGQQPGMARWKCICAYNGTGLGGWQSQRNTVSIQDLIEARLGAILARDVRIHGSGRTDAGVHAEGQVFHFDAHWPHSPAALLAALRLGLPPAIQIRSVRRVASDFHARFSARGKLYRYQIWQGCADPFQFPFFWSIPRSLDLEAMRAAAGQLKGRHDFRAFSALNGPPMKDTVRELRRLEITRRGSKLFIRAEADGFLYKMMRSLAGALVSVGLGKLSAEELRLILLSKQRTHRIQTAPPQGLFLVRVLY